MIKLEVLAADEVTRNLPLVVDLDGTLNPTDTLVESRIALATKSPLMLFRVPLWMIKGRARFKECVAAHAGITGTSRWKGLKTIGVVVYKSLIQGEERIDIRHFISSLPLGIEQFSKAVRRHWGIETTCHWSLGVTYGEDGVRTRQRTIAENLAWLRRSTLSMLKQHSGKDFLAMKRRICGWSDAFLMEVLGIRSI